MQLLRLWWLSEVNIFVDRQLSEVLKLQTIGTKLVEDLAVSWIVLVV